MIENIKPRNKFLNAARAAGVALSLFGAGELGAISGRGGVARGRITFHAGLYSKKEGGRKTKGGGRKKN